MKRFYVYAVLRDGIAYIGKGTGKRVLYSMKNHYGNGFLILENDLEEIEALILEKKLINEIHPPDNINHNRNYSGGSPTSLR